ncbi:YsnF/AvaK domain-containing protein [Micromonospora maritima]|uniref:YsnF/AvaK domain-containing protein n=1 Tax=Micromonospora maritima TaxID=986711 RepID=UPI00379FA3B2
MQGDRLTVPFDKSMVKNAPEVDAGSDEPLSSAEVADLYRHYGLSRDDDGGNTPTNGTAGGYDAAVDHGYADTSSERGVRPDTSGPNTDDAMPRSEERLNIGTERQQVGTARLRKYVATEHKQVTVPLQREEVRLEREPITDANIGKTLDGPAIGEEEHEVTLHAERPVVDTETVPVERVRLGKETDTDTGTAAGEVRKERIEADLPGEGRRDLN